MHMWFSRASVGGNGAAQRRPGSGVRAGRLRRSFAGLLAVVVVSGVPVVSQLFGTTTAGATASFGWAKATATPSPTPRYGGDTAYDPTAHELLLYGGNTTSTANLKTKTKTRHLGTTWAWNGTSWSEVTSGGAGPGYRTTALMAYDGATGQVLLYGGYGYTAATFPTTTPQKGYKVFRTLWAWTPGTGWKEITTGATNHQGTRSQGASMVYDATSGQLVVTGGGYTRTTTWAWTATSKWHEVAPASGRRTAFLWNTLGYTFPIPLAAMAYDPAIDKVVGLGNNQTSGIWEWTGTSWTALPSTTPADQMPWSNRGGESLQFDTALGKMVVVGGTGEPAGCPNCTPGPLDTTLEWTSTTGFAQITAGTSPGVTSPLANTFALAGYDAGSGQLVVVSGGTASTDASTWLFGRQRASAATSTSLSTPAAAVTYGEETTATLSVTVIGATGDGVPVGSVSVATGSTPVCTAVAGPATGTHTATFTCGLSANALPAGSHTGLVATFAPSPTASSTTPYVTYTGSSSTPPASLTVNQPLTFASGTTAYFPWLATGSFTITTTGTPAPTLTETGALPTGLVFSDNHNGTATISGRAGLFTLGSHSTVTVTATDGSGTPVTQTLHLVVGFTPLLLASPRATFTVGRDSRVVIASLASPTAALTESGTLPAGLTFTDNGNGTATLSGTPATGTAGSYTITITAKNGVGKTTQTFTLTVGEAPSFTSTSPATFVTGTQASYDITTSGYPTAKISESGSLPKGLRFKTNGNGTATISGAPAAGTGGTYAVTLSATNGVSKVTQALTVIVDQPPAITSASSATFTDKKAGSFTIRTTGYPNATITVASGSLPSTLKFTTNGNGTATISGTPTTSKKTTYKLSITATNGFGSKATQTLTLTVS